ncbi:hypothetical protein [Falsibacillus pallidus]|uniref:Uncharacterized protein n=1 Tax=Falsibacillus pallidus TaxID=493781 RepID=A0A370GAT3_9BACI|nr:hypothetical protein [Falsibacillus pallidus]RDI40905.1 hypothetical protein DFR59_11148 [Falsibacillus pallidus]
MKNNPNNNHTNTEEKTIGESLNTSLIDNSMDNLDIISTYLLKAIKLNTSHKIQKESA